MRIIEISLVATFAIPSLYHRFLTCHVMNSEFMPISVMIGWMAAEQAPVQARASGLFCVVQYRDRDRGLVGWHTGTLGIGRMVDWVFRHRFCLVSFELLMGTAVLGGGPL
jgi:hypothetical protein